MPLRKAIVKYVTISNLTAPNLWHQAAVMLLAHGWPTPPGCFPGEIREARGASTGVEKEGGKDKSKGKGSQSNRRPLHIWLSPLALRDSIVRKEGKAAVSGEMYQATPESRLGFEPDPSQW